MIITCPQCETSFAISDEVYKPGRKARCSHCSFVFPMPPMQTEEPEADESYDDPLASTPDAFSDAPAAENQPLSSSPAPKKGLLAKLLGQKPYIKGLVLACCCMGLVGGGFMLYKGFIASSAAQKQTVSEAEVKARREMRMKEAGARVEQDKAVSSITLLDVRQTVIENEKIGALVVIEGTARNDFAEPRSLITVEARLLNKEGIVLARSEQDCGISLNLTQLQVLTKAELLTALNNKIAIFATNTNVQPRQTVPFIIVFPKVPEDFYSYEVRPVKADLKSPVIN